MISDPLATVDLDRADVAAHLRAAAQAPGFFRVIGHGVAEERFAEALGLAQRFFGLDTTAKDEVAVADGVHRGWIGEGGAVMYAGAEPDRKESFVWGHDSERNRWPRQPAEMAPALLNLLDELSSTARRVLGSIAESLDRPPDTFLRSLDRPLSRGSIIHYPPGSGLGVKPHTDFGCLTLLWQDDVGGLEIRDATGKWRAVPPIAGTLVVNIGDLLARWTNDRFRSTEHRVTSPTRTHRYSMGVFFDPDEDTIVDPTDVIGADERARYEPITVGQHLADRYDAAFAYRRSSR